ncbi:carboxypeptidase inhibitor-like [Dermacentor variabilis]|uniref:carboxypeptidase inhibitor-like n=1 Tax=Dermacentor variabilis TaxID=34621 RepID=UPI003F5B8CE4
MAAPLLVVCFALALAFSQANDCVSRGFGCLPKSDCPQEARLSYRGCSTVCCDLTKLTGCKGKGGECNPLNRICKELESESSSCPRDQKCCVWLQ